MGVGVEVGLGARVGIMVGDDPVVDDCPGPEVFLPQTMEKKDPSLLVHGTGSHTSCARL